MINIRTTRKTTISGGKVSEEGGTDVKGANKGTITLNGKQITSDGFYKDSTNSNVSSNTTTSTVSTNASTEVVKSEAKKDVKADDKKAAKGKEKGKEKDERSFWQRHPVLRVLLIVFLCLLTIGLLAIAAYHIMHAINNSKKNDKIDEAKKADEEIKKNKDKLSEENQKKLEEGKLTQNDVDKEITRQENDKKLAEETKGYIDQYNQETDATKKGEIATAYANSQSQALKSGKLNSTSLQETLNKEKSELDIADAGVNEAASSARAVGISDADIDTIKGNSEASVTGSTDAQTNAIQALKDSVRKQTQEQADVTYVQDKLADVQAYENATTDSEKAAALTKFTTNEETRFTPTTITTGTGTAATTTTTPPAISSEDAQKWSSWESSELQGAQDFSQSFDEQVFSKSFNTISDIAKDNGFTYKAGTTTTDEITKAIESNYADKFPKSDGAFRIAGDAAAAAGAAGLVGTGIAALIANSKDKKGKTVVKQNVDNGNADKNTKTITKTTTTTVAK